MRILVVLLLLLLTTSIQAQFSATKLTEYQYGKLGTADEDLFHSAYSRLMLNYGYHDFKFTFGGQAYYTPYEERNYFDPMWMSASYKKKGWDLKLGNFNETIGRGILLRSFEIPGALLEDKGFRSKNYFNRDVLGARAGYRGKNFAVKALYGAAKNNLIPPTQELEARRPDIIGAISGEYTLRQQTLGLSALRHTHKEEDSFYSLASIGGNIGSKLSYFAAYATYVGGNLEGASTKNNYALYGSLNLSLNAVGLSLEWKDYKNFFLGAGINEPPALVREHSYRTLNRTTHVLQPVNEKGVQLEAYYQLGVWTTFTVNYTWAQNTFHETFDYHEVFAEVSTTVASTDVKLFVDWAVDPFEGVENRISTGFLIDKGIGKGYGLRLEAEWQNFERYEEKVANYATTLTFRKGSKIYLSLNTELSSDAFLVEDNQDQKIWLGGTARYKLNRKHNLQLFAGERRGGPACSAGICYEVLDFKGVELRWNARF